ncbi:MAG: DcrB-related protein [Xanthomonadales bacterium]|nr:DcrB-related protein [Xanthomonadales bacterium]
MTSFKGANFSLELPDDTVDASSYCFCFPDLGTMPPNLTVTSQQFDDKSSLEEFTESRTAPMRDSLDEFEVVSEQRYQRDNWDYIISIVQWTAGSVVTRQKRLFIHVAKPANKIYSLVATDLAENAEKSEPTIDGIIRSFQPDSG